MRLSNFHVTALIKFLWTVIILILLSPALIFCQEEKAVPNSLPEPSSNNLTQEASSLVAEDRGPAKVLPSEYVKKSWEASGKNNLTFVIELTNECIENYGQEAQRQQASLNNFPVSGQEKDYEVLNDVGTCMFIQAEALMNNGRGEEAKSIFERAIKEYKWAQAWDPSRGSFWSIAEKSQASIDVLTGVRSEEADIEDKTVLRTVPHLYAKGNQEIVDYRQYGQFVGIGTKDYQYQIQDAQGLSSALGEGIYPNTGSVQKNPGYKKAKQEGRLEGSHWDFVHSDDLEAAYYKWATAPEPWGVKLFYLGMIFEKAKMNYEAIKAYHALVVHFPQAVGWTYWHTPWYPAQAAIAKIKFLIRQHPELNLKMNWAKVQVMNGFDNDISNDIVITFPGVISKKGFWDLAMEKFNLDRIKLKLGKVVKRIGEGRVRLVQYDNKHWQLMVDGKPFIIRGVTYSPTKIGQTPDKGTLVSWMIQDSNQNGLPDGPFDSWVDANRNSQQDPDERVVGDFQLLKEMGANTIREYHQPFAPQKELLRKMYNEYGMHVIMGDFLGKYTFGSGASWYEGTDYENPQHRKNMMESVKSMVMEFKDEPYILMWLLGNENNYGVASNADKKPEAFYRFVNEVALMIKSLDKNHPVAVCNGDTLYLDIFAKNAPEVDIFSANAYRGDYGFGPFWEQVADASGKPAFISEYGSPAYAKHLSMKEGEEAQRAYHEGNWRDIEDNMAGNSQGVGNALGGIVFEWLDEWWKNYEPYFHDKKSSTIGPFPGGYYYEEWFGLSTQGNGKHSPFLRQLRPSYFLYKKLWN